MAAKVTRVNCQIRDIQLCGVRWREKEGEIFSNSGFTVGAERLAQYY